MDTSLTAFMETQLKQVTSAFHRYMYPRISYVVRDDIEYGSGNAIPLWAFGLLY